MEKAEPMFVGFVLGRCEMILETFRDDLPNEVYDSLVMMRDTASEIAKTYYSDEKKAEVQSPSKMDNQPANSRQRKPKAV